MELNNSTRDVLATVLGLWSRVFGENSTYQVDRQCCCYRTGVYDIMVKTRLTSAISRLCYSIAKVVCPIEVFVNITSNLPGTYVDNTILLLSWNLFSEEV